MPAPKIVKQGEDCDLTFTPALTKTNSYMHTLEVKRFPGDDAAISREVAQESDYTIKVTLTPTETAGLAIGLWYVILVSTNDDEGLLTVTRIQITKAWS